MRGRAARGPAHPKACEILKKSVLPVLRDDDIAKLIRYDELIVVYGNKLCRKYRSPHHYKMLRARLRLIARFLKEMKELDSEINNLTSVYIPGKYDTVLEAIHKCAKFDTETLKFKTPAVAFNLGTELKYIGQLLITECIKNENNERKKQVKDFLLLMKDDYGTSINKTVAENQYEQKRKKEINLPTIDDIKTLNNFLCNKRKALYSTLQKKYDFDTWKQLSEIVLTSVQLFNRRRAGEIERTHLTDIEHLQRVDEQINADVFNSLSETSKQRARTYVRYLIRGKLNRTVPVLLSEELLESIRLLIAFRKDAGIPENNSYLFALPGEDRERHLEACNLMRKFSVACKAKVPALLRGTLLRKHIATYSVLLNLEESEKSDLADYIWDTRRKFIKNTIEFLLWRETLRRCHIFWHWHRELMRSKCILMSSRGILVTQQKMRFTTLKT